MTLLVSDVLTAARDRSPAFTRERHPDAVLVRALTQAHAALVPKALVANRDALGLRTRVALPLADHMAGEALPPHGALVGVELVPLPETVNGPWSARPQPLILTDRDGARSLRRAAWVEGTGDEAVLYLTGPASAYAPFAALDLLLVPSPDDRFTQLAEELTLPDGALQPLAGALAALMAERGHGTAQEAALHTRLDPSQYAARAAMDEQAFLYALSARRVGRTFTVRAAD